MQLTDFSENGGPLTFNVVLISAQRKAGFVASWRRQPCVPGRFSGHCVLAWSSPALRPGTVFAGIASTDVPQCNASDLRAVFHPREAGIATWHDPRQPCVPARSLPALRLISPVTGSSLFSRERSEPLHNALSRRLILSENGKPLTVDLRGLLRSSIT